MNEKNDTVEIMGKKFLKCQQEDCEWNIGWLGGYDWTKDSGKGTRVCNLGARAMIGSNAKPPDICQQPFAVLELARTELEI
jgi:hypothetical protein